MLWVKVQFHQVLQIHTKPRDIKLKTGTRDKQREIYVLTLVDMEEGLPQLAGEQRLRQIPEELLHHVGHIIGRLILIVHIVWRTLIHVPQSLNPRLHPRLTKETHLEAKHKRYC